MSASLRAPVIVAFVAVVVGSRAAAELVGRAIGTRLVEHYSLYLTLFGATSIAVGVVAVLVCRRLAVGRGVQPRVALGAGLAMGSLPIGRGIDTLTDAGFWAVFEIGNLPPSLVLDILRLVTGAVVAVCVFAGLRMVGATLRHALLVVVGLAVLLVAVPRFLDPVGYDQQDLRRVLEVRYWVITVGLPALTAVGVLILARRPSEEPVPA